MSAESIFVDNDEKEETLNEGEDEKLKDLPKIVSEEKPELTKTGRVKTKRVMSEKQKENLAAARHKSAMNRRQRKIDKEQLQKQSDKDDYVRDLEEKITRQIMAKLTREQKEQLPEKHSKPITAPKEPEKDNNIKPPPEPKPITVAKKPERKTKVKKEPAPNPIEKVKQPERKKELTPAEIQQLRFQEMINNAYS